MLRKGYYGAGLRKLGQRASFETGTCIKGAGNISIGDDFFGGLRCALIAHGGGAIALGNRVRINSNVEINASVNGCISIGDDVLIGPNVVFRSSSHSFARRDIPIAIQGHDAGITTVGDDVWIGAGATIVGNVEIGKGAVVAAGAVVVRNIDPYSVVGGVPARLIKSRGNSESGLSEASSTKAL